MSTWIAWGPTESPEERFPRNFLEGDPLGEFQSGTESESCQVCGFTVDWMSDNYQYENYNDETRRFISSLLGKQNEAGDCPDHPKPNWMA